MELAEPLARLRLISARLLPVQYTAVGVPLVEVSCPAIEMAVPDPEIELAMAAPKPVPVRGVWTGVAAVPAMVQ